jgi:hypothetical protein
MINGATLYKLLSRFRLHPNFANDLPRVGSTVADNILIGTGHVIKRRVARHYAGKGGVIRDVVYLMAIYKHPPAVFQAINVVSS